MPELRTLAGCTHAPIPDTITKEGQYDLLQITLATSLDAQTFPRLALCKLCGRGIRLISLISDWALVNGDAPEASPAHTPADTA